MQFIEAMEALERKLGIIEIQCGYTARYIIAHHIHNKQGPIMLNPDSCTGYDAEGLWKRMDMDRKVTRLGKMKLEEHHIVGADVGPGGKTVPGYTIETKAGTPIYIFRGEGASYNIFGHLSLVTGAYAMEKESPFDLGTRKVCSTLNVETIYERS